MLRARLLIAAATVALLALIIILVTGGFTIHVGLLRITAHNPRGPLLIAVIAVAAAALSGRVALADAAASTWRFIDEHALATSLVIAAATVGVGVAFGTYAASASDASGYVSEARLLGAGRITDDEPLARQVAWPNATWAFSPLGYRPGPEPGELAPTYPSGLPLVIASARAIGGELASYFVVPILGGLAVLATYGLGARLHSRAAGVVASALLATSPVFLFQLVQPMSDVAVTAWWSIAFLFAVSPVPGGPLAAGAAAGLALLTRPNLAPLAAVVALAVVNWPRGGGERRVQMHNLLAFVVGITPAVGALALVQWQLYGNPLTSGYGSAAALFGTANIRPNAIAYAERMLHGERPALIIAAGALALLFVLPTSRDQPILPSSKRLLTLAALTAAIVVTSYLPYAVFAEWSYLRFLLPAFPLLFAGVGALLVKAVSRLPPSLRGVTVLATVVLASSLNVVRAGDEQAFNLQRYESRYRLAGRYLESALPRDAVIVAVQQSGSARYYSGVPILRWDQLDVDFDVALAALRTMGRHPVLLVEAWETADLQKKFPTSVSARLDWSPRAEFGDETRVRLFDPLDRDAVRSWRPDRVH